MKKYYLIGSIIAVIVFFIMFILGCISAFDSSNKRKEQIGEIENNTVVLRYYENDDFDNSRIIYVRLMDKTNYQITNLPSKEGYRFVGLYNGADYNTAQIYVDSNGYGVVPLTEDILLYPVFVEG